jgi:hypothetical protein
MGLLAGVLGLGQVLGAVAQNHGFARARHAVDDAVPVAQGPGQLLLLQVHHAHDAGQVGLGLGVVKQVASGLHAHLGEHDPAHAVQLRQADDPAHAVGEHVPQAALQVFGVCALQHFVLANDALGFQGLAQFAVVKLFAGDVGQHHAVAPRKSQLARVAAISLHQLRVAFQRVDDLVGVLAGLLQRAGHGFRHAVWRNDPLVLSACWMVDSFQSFTSSTRMPLLGCSTTKSGWVCRGPMGTSYHSR